jgi:hypothetical protein
MVKFNKKKVETKIKLKESEEVLDNSIEKDIMEELGITDDDINDSEEITSEEIDMDDVDVTSDSEDDIQLEDDMTPEEDNIDLDNDIQLEDDLDSDMGDIDSDVEDIQLEDDMDSDVDDIQLEDDMTPEEDNIDLDLDDSEDLENDLDDSEDNIQLEDDLDNLDVDDDMELDTDDSQTLTEEEIDNQIANLQAQKESLQKEGAEMVPAKVLSETRSALKKMGIDFIKTKRANEAMRIKMNALVKENATLKLDEKKAEAVITLLAKSEIPKKGKYKIIESIDNAKNTKEVQVKFNKISKLLAETTKNKTLNKITESSKSGAGKKVENAGLSLRDKYLLGISDEYLSSENYMK